MMNADASHTLHAPHLHLLREEIRAEALRLGFSRTGFTTADPLPEAQQRRWQRWFAEAKHGAMGYLARLVPRRTHPRDLLPEARSAVVVLAGYYDGDHDPAPASESGASGKIARYAWGRDYHEVLRERLARLGDWIARRAGEMGLPEPVTVRPCVDSAPVDERALAVRAGLGFTGKNTLLLDPRHGSWALIGVLLCSLDLPPDEPLKNRAASCGACRRCLEACPTGALNAQAPYRMDPRRCISYLTIEQKDEIPPDLAAGMNGWAFGCDICQEVCPFNADPLNRLLPELAAIEGPGPWLTESSLKAFPSGKAFLRRWAHTPLSRPGLKGLLRNLRAGARDQSAASLDKD